MIREIPQRRTSRRRRTQRNIFLSALAAITALALAACSFGGSSNASSGTKHYIIKYSIGNGPTDPQVIAANQFAKTVAQKSGGRITVQVYPNSQLGTATQITQDVAQGSVQMENQVLSNIVSFVPSLEVPSLPFLWSSRDELFTSLNGAFGDTIKSDMAKKNFNVLGYLDLGWFQLVTKSPVKTLGDLSGVKVRTTPSNDDQKLVSEVNGIPVPLATSELYTGLETGTVNGAVLPVTTILSQKYFEVAKYLTNVNVEYDLSIEFINKQFLASLPADLQKVVEDAGAANATYQQQLQASQGAQQLATLEKDGMKVSTLSSSELTKWEALTKTEVLADIPAKYPALWGQIAKS